MRINYILMYESILGFYMICSSARNGTTFTCKKTKVINKHFVVRFIMGFNAKYNNTKTSYVIEFLIWAY